MTDFYWEPTRSVRTKHLYIPGASGYGKTVLMTNLALDDIEARRGPVIIIDPKGSKEGLVNRVIKHIPKSMIPNVFYISQHHPAPIDLLSFRDQFEKNMIKDDIRTILEHFSFGQWGTTMQGIINKLVPTLLEAEDATFLDIGVFLEDKNRQEEILSQVSPERRRYWKQHPPKEADYGPITRRMSNFDDPPLRSIVNSRRGQGINIADIIAKNQVLLVDTSPLNNDGLMLGALIMSRVRQAIFRRDPDKEHPVCTVYADEFHHMKTSEFGEMITQARSFGLSLCLANQHPVQLVENKIWDDVKGISTYIIFRMDGEHAAMLRSKIKDPPFDPPPIEKPDIRAIKDHINGMKARIAYWEKRDDGGKECHEAENTLYHLEHELREAEDFVPEKPKKPLTFLERIPSLPVGQAIFIHHTGETAKIKTPDVPIPPSYNYMEEIIEHTRAASAQSGQKRSVDQPPSNSPQVPHTEGNGNTHSEPQAGKSPTPHDQRKTGKP